ncbi:hypothetical protein BDN72DRAFT_957766 [Pluteus cervinus]|uniref:Uncharacterized protein n=1 Tax=Pluteus cervinus TaxID=181527 RepID=A0ACD3B1Y9_9AGAR|nr:hypothetical protein BDN72DRAFT_957766 [Pluteus cervinus]
MSKEESIYLSKGLLGQDDNWDILERIWETRLQFSTLETVNPTLDLLTFSQSVPYFGVIFAASALPQPEAALRTNDPDSDVRSWRSSQPPTGKVVGLIYLACADPHVGSTKELNIGIAVKADSEGQGYAKRALELMLHHAFNELECHRVQAPMIDHWGKERALALFTKTKFIHEGTRRRSFWSPVDEQWKDLTYLAMLDTDWALRMVWLPAPNSLWDELFQRHQRERDELLSWEDRRDRTIKRTSSMETILPSTAPQQSSQHEPQQSGSQEDTEMISASPKFKGKGKMADEGDLSDGYISSTFDASDASDVEEAPSSPHAVPDSPSHHSSLRSEASITPPPSDPLFPDESSLTHRVQKSPSPSSSRGPSPSPSSNSRNTKASAEPLLQTGVRADSPVIPERSPSPASSMSSFASGAPPSDSESDMDQTHSSTSEWEVLSDEELEYM